MIKGCIKIFAAVLVFVQAIAIHTAQAEEYRQHEAHEHGVAHLNVAVEGNNLTLEFFSPAANIVGFEYHPRTQAQKDQVKQARKKLDAAQTLFQLPAQAQGRLVKTMIGTDIDSDAADGLHHHEAAGVHGEDEKDGHDPHGHEHERHSDFRAEYHFICNKPEKLAYLDVMLLRLFPGIERIKTQILTDTGQTAKELTAKNYRITF